MLCLRIQTYGFLLSLFFRTGVEPSDIFHRRDFQVVLQIAATGGGWPLQLQERLLQLLNTPCEVELELELDESQGDT